MFIFSEKWVKFIATVEQMSRVERNKTKKKTYHGADCCSDHYAVAAKFKLKLTKIMSTPKHIIPDLVLLNCNQPLQEKFCMDVQNKFEVSREAEELDQQWIKFKSAVTEVAMEQILRDKRKAKQMWIAEDILELIEKRGQEKNSSE